MDENNPVQVDTESKIVNSVQSSAEISGEDIVHLTSSIDHSISNWIENSSQMNDLSSINDSENGVASFLAQNMNVFAGGAAEISSALEISTLEKCWDEVNLSGSMNQVAECSPSALCEKSLQLKDINTFSANGASSLDQNHQIISERNSENTPVVCLKEPWGRNTPCVESVGVVECSLSNCSSQSKGTNSANGNEDCDPFSNQTANGGRSKNLSQVEGNVLEECWNKGNRIVKKNGNREGHTLNLPGNLSASISNSSLNEVLLVTFDDGSNNPVSHNYRNNSESSVSDLSSSSEDDSVTETIDWDENIRKGSRRHEPTCRGEFLLSDLPPIEDLAISVTEEECVKVGIVSSIVDELVVVQALPNTPALDLGTVLFLQNGKVTLGNIFDVLGQVKEPFYTVRFNSECHARERGVTVKADVYCAPKTDHTSYVFVSEMLKMKGSDASWEHNNEPPSVCLDYSDDEEERLARRALTSQKHGEEKDNGPPRKKRGVCRKLPNPFHVTGKNNINPGGSDADSIRPEVLPIGGCVIPAAPRLPLSSPVFPPRPMYPPVNTHLSRPIHPPGHPPVMFSSPPPNFSLPFRAGYRSSLLGPHPRNFQPTLSPTMPPPHPFFVRPFHVLPSLSLPPPAPLPPYISPHVRPLLCPPRFQPSLHEKNGPGCL